MKQYAVLVAGGQGIRMKGVLPKQFLELCGKPVLMHTIERFSGIEIILVMNADYISLWKELCSEFKFNIPHTLIAGGKSRAESVLNGIRNLENDSFVAVHDAVRPLICASLIKKLFEEAMVHGSAIPVVAVKDTLRELSADGSITVPRERYRAVQTPQVFPTSALKQAFNVEGFEKFTDEASLFQAAGNKIHLTEGDEKNIKLTVPADLILAESFLREEKP